MAWMGKRHPVTALFVAAVAVFMLGTILSYQSYLESRDPTASCFCWSARARPCC